MACFHSFVLFTQSYLTLVRQETYVLATTFCLSLSAIQLSAGEEVKQSAITRYVNREAQLLEQAPHLEYAVFIVM